jgi:hypothetical protein
LKIGVAMAGRGTTFLAEDVQAHGGRQMTGSSKASVKRGMELAATLPDIMPDQADRRIKPIYEDIQATLRVPVVNLIFRTLANYPEYLERGWGQLREIARLRVFEEAADAVRESAILQPAPEPLKVEAAQQLRVFNDTIHYVLPKLLLAVTALEQASFGKDGGGRPLATPTASTIPQGIAEGTGKVKMVEPGSADERLRALFESIKQRHGHSLVSSYYRGLGNWPEFLRAAWDTIAVYVGSPEYTQRSEALVEQSLVHVRQWPLAPVNPAGEQRADIQDILAAFRHKIIPEMLLDVALIKCALEGEEAARISRFSAAR